MRRLSLVALAVLLASCAAQPSRVTAANPTAPASTASPTAAPAASSDPADVSNTAGALLIFVNDTPELIILISTQGQYTYASFAACIQDDKCSALLQKLHDANKLDAIVLKVDTSAPSRSL